MNFLFDLIASQPNNDGDFHGGGKYAKKVFFAFLESGHGQVTRFALYDSARRLDESIRRAAGEHGVKLLDIKGATVPQLISENQVTRLYTALPFGLVRHGLFDVDPAKCTVYCTIHGLRNMEVKAGISALQYFPLTDLKGRARTLVKSVFASRVVRRDINRYQQLFRNSTVFTVSNHTKYSILTHFPDIVQPVRVAYSPDVTEFEDVTVDVQAEQFSGSNYFLLISGNRWLKNNMRSILALDNLFSTQKLLNQQVIVTGVSQPDVFLSRIRNKDRFVFYDYVSEVFLKKLYSNAFAFIYMTLNEGFGYPPLDAMKAGVPVITSPFTSIPEVCGNAVLYANPYSVPEIRNRILQLTDNQIRERLITDGYARYDLIRERQDSDLHKMISVLLE